jgi:hypothetical protein
LSLLSPPWGLKGLEVKPLPRAKRNHGASVSYTRELRTPIKTFGIGFWNRDRQGEPDDNAGWDDSLIVDFNIDHKSIDYPHLVREVLPAYVEAMGAYMGVIMEDHILGTDSYCTDAEGQSRSRPDKINFRHGVRRIWPANYWDRELCQRAFSLTPEQVVNRLTSHVAEARILRDGALVIYSYDRVPDDQIALIDGQLRPLLLSKPKLAWSR